MIKHHPASSRDDSWRQRREDILAVAANLLAERGYHGATMHDVAARAGCSVGYLYKHFPGKRDLAREIVDRELAQLERIESDVRARGLAPLATYRELLEESSRFLSQRWALVRIFAGNSVLRRLPTTSERYQRMRARDRELLARAQDCGDLPDIDIDLVSAALAGTIDDLMTHLTDGADATAVLRLPDLVFELVIDPLRARARANRTPEDGLHADPTENQA